MEGLETWTGEQQQSARDLLVDSADVFSQSDLDFCKCNIIQHAIKITDTQPFKERYRRVPPHLYEEVKKHLQEMVEVGAIKSSFSPWASVVVLVRKKDGGAEVLYQPTKIEQQNYQGWVFITQNRGYLRLLAWCSVVFYSGLEIRVLAG